MKNKDIVLKEDADEIDIKIAPDWYKINNTWYHCITLENGDRFINGELQSNEYEK